MSSNQTRKLILKAIAETSETVGNCELKLLQVLSVAHDNSNNEKHSSSYQPDTVNSIHLLPCLMEVLSFN